MAVTPLPSNSETAISERTRRHCRTTARTSDGILAYGYVSPSFLESEIASKANSNESLAPPAKNDKESFFIPSKSSITRLNFDERDGADFSYYNISLESDPTS